MNRIRAASNRLVGAMISGSPTTRFTLGIEFDDDLNHYPRTKPAGDPLEARGRRFDAAEQPLSLRIERQTTIGMPEENAALFLIRVHLCDFRIPRADRAHRDAVIAALRSMSPESREYKGVDGCLEDVIGFLNTGGDPLP